MKKNSKQLMKEAKAVFKERRRTNKIPGVKLVCNSCHEEHHVRTHRPELYTEEVRRTWQCLVCTPLKKARSSGNPQST